MQITSEMMATIIVVCAGAHLGAWRKHGNNWDLALVIPLCWMLIYYLHLGKEGTFSQIQFRESIIRPATVTYLLINLSAAFEPELVKLWLRFSKWRGGNPNEP